MSIWLHHHVRVPRCWASGPLRVDVAPPCFCWLRQIRFQSGPSVPQGTWQVSSFGRVKTLRGVISDGSSTDEGYRVAGIERKNYLVHRLVARAFHGPPPTAEHKQVNHLDGNREKNRADNLEYVTRSENLRHARASGSWQRKTGPAKPVHCRRIGASAWSSFSSQSEAASVLGLSVTSVRKCCNGHVQHVQGHEFKLAEPVFLTGELWGAARYPGVKQAIAEWQVSSFGRVKAARGRITFGSLTRAGYRVIHAQMESGVPFKGLRVHRLVAATFLGEPAAADLHVNHLDGNRSNNCLDNLRYATPSENVQHAHDRLAKIDKPNLWKPVLAREVGAPGWIPVQSVSAAAAQTGVSRSSIARVCRGERSSVRNWEFKYAACEQLPDEEWRNVILDWSCLHIEPGQPGVNARHPAGQPPA